MNSPTNTALTFHNPKPSDGKLLWQLVKDSGVLDLNSCYAYILLCEHFSETCMVAKAGERLVGFVTGYRLPNQANTLFIWQVAVDAGFQGRGIASTLLQNLISCQKPLPHLVQTTVSPSNLASRHLFTKLAAWLETDLTVEPGFSEALFQPGSTHEAEPLLTIGPFTATRTS